MRTSFFRLYHAYVPVQRGRGVAERSATRVPGKISRIVNLRVRIIESHVEKKGSARRPLGRNKFHRFGIVVVNQIIGIDILKGREIGECVIRVFFLLHRFLGDRS